MTVTTEVVTITPAMAKQMLDRNENNRRVKEHTVDRYARDIAAGKWRMSGEPVKFDIDGVLLDGQHRLLACIRADMPFETIVVRGLQIEAQTVMDTGTKRSFADVLRMRGEASTSSLAAAVEVGLSWDEAGTPAHRGRVHSNAERLAWLEANPDIRDAVRIANGLAGPPLRLPISVGGAFLMRANRVSPPEASAFANLLKTGAGLNESDPIYRLRSWLLSQGTSKARLPREHHAALTVKAWNAWIEGRTMRQLTWKRGGANREEFPLLRTPDGAWYEERLTEPVTPTRGSFSAIEGGAQEQSEAV